MCTLLDLVVQLLEEIAYLANVSIACLTHAYTPGHLSTFRIDLSTVNTPTLCLGTPVIFWYDEITEVRK